MSNELDILLEKVAPDTLPSLLSVCRITVPSTQRNYVQGADNPKAKQVRERFVGDVLSAFKKGLELKLDFVFGPIDTTGVDSFVPVDGQQRITTVWLLLRYAAEYIQEEKTRANLLSLLGRFSYEGRPYAKRFCQALTQVGCPRWMDSKKSERPSVTLFCEGVASHGWLEDGTVAAMVNMLDTIHEKWKESAIDEHAKDFIVFLWEKVVFRVCTDHFSDDLYMKMNARGLSLTQWENAKGEFADWISDQDWKGRIEKASNAFFEKFNANECNGREEKIHLPDDPFFALIGRIARYELHCANKDIPSSLQELANVKVDSDELPFVPLSDFSGISKDKKAEMLSIFLRILDFTLLQPCEGVKNPSWVKRGFLKTLFIPNNRDDADFSLMLYAYFKHLDTDVKLNVEAVTSSLRLFWNVLQNVSYNETKPFDRVDQVVNYFIGSNATVGNLYLGIAREVPKNGSDQYREEVAKMDLYKEGGETLSLLQSVENRLNGRVRLAVLELSAGGCSTMDVAKRRLEAIANLFARWDSQKNRASVMREVILAEPLDLNKEEVAWRINDDNLREMLTNKNDYVLQKSLVDGLRDECEECTFVPQGGWERDWRKNVLTFLNVDIFNEDRYNAVITEDERRLHIRKHRDTGINFLYVMTNCNNARPIGDWRFDLQASGISQDLKNLSAYGMSSIFINDGGTYSFPLALVEENERINIYFWKDRIQVCWFDYSCKGKEQREVPIPETAINSSWVVQTIKEQVDLMRRNRPHG